MLKLWLHVPVQFFSDSVLLKLPLLVLMDEENVEENLSDVGVDDGGW